MTAENVPLTGPTQASEPAPAETPVQDGTTQAAIDRWSRPYAGWMVVGRKEFADHLLSIRFIVLVIVLGLAAFVPLFFAADRIRSAASAASGTPAIFLYLFYLSSSSDTSSFAIPGVVDFLRMFAPLLGIAFAFDAVNGERSEGTLPRLLSQPIHRDDVINGKFAAGLAIIAVVVAGVLALIAGVGLFRIGVIPAPAEVLRLMAWLIVTLVYVSLWLAFGMLLSVVVRRAATSALIGFGTWFLLTFLGQLIVSFVAGVIAPLSSTLANADPEQYLSNAGAQETLYRVLPDTLYKEASYVLLNPSITTTSTPATLSQFTQAQQQLGSLLSLDQSFIVVWPQVVALVALTVACFALAYVQFMRQEVRA
jgi:ABC-2 type transport system permease protein